MVSKKITAETAALTTRDLELIAKAWTCLMNPQIDMAKFAEITNYKNKATASACWSVVRAKLAFHDAAGCAGISADTAATTSGVPGSATKRKANGGGGGRVKGAAVNATNGNGEDDSETNTGPPKKKQRIRKGGTTASTPSPPIDGEGPAGKGKAPAPQAGSSLKTKFHFEEDQDADQGYESFEGFDFDNILGSTLWRPT
ncbi:hypothetical protein SLS62_002265 [Diatrype stigma]|uniref:Uncharacterized protein n=1 Tax=Diatrype stigma TaxID=117547 RepID=A0AAN9V6X5_9PEZI